jgi:hypothetical protein
LIDNVYNWDAFTIDPDWCRIKYSFDTDAEDPVIKDNLRETIHLNGWKETIRYGWPNDTSLSGPIKKDYKVTIIATAGKDSGVKSAVSTYTLTVHNPCINPEFYAIEGRIDPRVSSVDYILYSQSSFPLINHFRYELLIDPWRPRKICGESEYITTFNGEVVT